MKARIAVIVAAVFLLAVGLIAFTLTRSSPADATSASASSSATLPTSAPVRTILPPEMKAEIIATNLKAPWAISFLPDGRIFFTERDGRVRVIANGQLLPEPALTVPDIKVWSKMGLLGMALDPNFERNHFIYLSECYGDQDHNFSRVVRYREDQNKLVEPRPLITDIPAFWNHNGGRIKFGPDRKLYLTTGDADKPPLAQDLKSVAGKILRLNTDGTAPADNPFVGRDDALPVIWSYGHRNPQGLTWQPSSNALFAPEHGPDGGDEFNLILPGQNYGWPVVSHKRSREGMISPLVEFTPSIGPADAVFYNADLFPTLNGDLLVGAMRGEAIIRVRFDGHSIASVERMLFKQFGRIREVAIAPDGAIWITTSEIDPPDGRNLPEFDKIIRLTPTGRDLPAVDPVPDARQLPKPVGAEAIFTQTCTVCHGNSVVNTMQPSLFDAQWNHGSDDASIRRNITNGIAERGMPSFKDKLTDAEIGELVAYIRKRGTATSTQP
ncbi:MAG: PQQ-dependent sugar dehydrogenase [Tepidisphaeraceae bacterium]